MKEISKTRNLIFPHHINWSLHHIPNEPLVEITSAWGTYVLDSDRIHMALNSGSIFGFIGCGDSHRFLPGMSGALAGIYAKSLTKKDVLDALRNRRCFATTGSRTLVAFWINGKIMGSEMTITSPPRIEWSIETFSGTEAATIELVRNGEVINTTKNEGEYIDADIPKQNNWYYLRVTEHREYVKYDHNVAQAFGKWAWSSPIWVRLSD